MGKTNEEAQSAGLHNVLAAGTVLTGKIETASDFRLDGRIDGEVFCKGKIVIGPKGCIKGNITTDNAEILGDVEGTIRVRERLILRATAVIKGDIYIQTLEIEPGAKFNGSCSMGEQNTAMPPQSANQTK